MKRLRPQSVMVLYSYVTYSGSSNAPQQMMSVSR